MNHQVFKKTVLLLFIWSFGINLFSQNFPGSSWEYYEESDMSFWPIEKRMNLQKYIVDSTKVTSLMVIHNGKVAFQYGDVEQQNYIASCRKSVLSMLYGKYIDNGKIDLSRTLSELNIDDVGGVLPMESKATIQDLITSRSGIYRPASNPGTWVQFIKKRGTVEPGTRWLYNNWDFNVAGYLFEMLSEKNIYDEIDEQFAKPLQMEDWNRSIQKKVGNVEKSKYLAYAMWFSTRDLARLGMLMLNNGKWKDKQIISESWMKDMIKERTTPEEMQTSAPIMKRIPYNFGYGYMWWLWRNNEDSRLKNAYSAFGAYGQSITVFPEMEMVVVFNTKAEYGRANDGLTTQTLPKKVLDSLGQE